jgi:hypothetical protein
MGRLSTLRCPYVELGDIGDVVNECQSAQSIAVLFLSVRGALAVVGFVGLKSSVAEDHAVLPPTLPSSLRPPRFSQHTLPCQHAWAFYSVSSIYPPPRCGSHLLPTHQHGQRKKSIG